MQKPLQLNELVDIAFILFYFILFFLIWGLGTFYELAPKYSRIR
jgi:hypothetical protein